MDYGDGKNAGLEINGSEEYWRLFLDSNWNNMVLQGRLKRVKKGFQDKNLRNQTQELKII